MRALARSLRRHPASTAAAVGMAAIGIAMLTVALTLHDAAHWRGLPFPGAHQMVVLTSSHVSPREVRSRVAWSFPRLQLLRDRATTVDLVSPWRPASVTLTTGETPQVIAGEFVSPEYFTLTGVAPVDGRAFSADEDRPATAVPVVVIAAGLRDRLRQDGTPITVGTPLQLNGQPVTVIGVMPASFRGLTGSAEFWLPTPMAPVLTYPEYLTTNQDFITLLARRRPGVADDAVRSEVAVLAAAGYRAMPSDDVREDVTVGGEVQSLGAARLRPEVSRASSLLVTGATVLFLLTLANLAALVMGRAVARRRESAVGLALGATPLRLWRQFAAEGAALVAGGALVALVTLTGWWLANGSLDPLGTLGRGFFSTWTAVTVDLRLLGWWILVSTLAVLIIAAIPATWAARRVTLGDLRAGSHAAAATGVSLRRPGVGAVLLGVEALLAVVLVGAAAQLLESYRRVQSATIGVDVERVLTFEVQPSERDVPADAAPAFVGRVLDALCTVPGVVSASVDGGAPLSGSASTGLQVVGRAEAGGGDPPMVLRHYVGEDHFSTLGIPVLAGRGFHATDREGAPRVVVISASAARQYFPAGDAVGQRVWFTGSTMTSPDSSGEIVGIVGDVRYDPPLGAHTTASFYTPYRQFTYGWRVYFVKVTGDPRAMERPLAAAVSRVAPGLPLRNVRPLAEVLHHARATPRRAASGTTALAVLGLLLAACGTWAVVSHATAQRTRDIAIRIAHGATTAGVLRLVLIDGLAWPMAGLTTGVACSIAGSGVLRALLYGVAPGAPLTVVAGAAVFALAALVACLLPAWRATRVNPIDALRAD
ncbi:MAG: ABC transporter permease [Gemmatimonadetes bacterium]|nr:ABC transporter permease [Gemmatimonadota bacterium]